MSDSLPRDSGAPDPPAAAFVPEYAKPDVPGVYAGFDNTVAVYHVVGPDDGFETAARGVIARLRDAQDRFPDWPRTLYLDVAGHAGDAAGFTPDMYELQQDFLFSSVAPFVSALETPVTGGLVNPSPQRNDVPHRLSFGGDTRPHAGQVIGDH